MVVKVVALVIHVAIVIQPLHFGPLVGCGDLGSAGQGKFCSNKE